MNRPFLTCFLVLFSNTVYTTSLLHIVYLFIKCFFLQKITLILCFQEGLLSDPSPCKPIPLLFVIVESLVLCRYRSVVYIKAIDEDKRNFVSMNYIDVDLTNKAQELCDIQKATNGYPSLSSMHLSFKTD